MDLCAHWITVAPSNHSSNRLGLALEDCFYTAILGAAGPAAQVKLLRLALQRIPECPFLHHTARDEDV